MKANELMIGDWVMFDPNVFIEDEYEPYHKPYPYQIKTGECIDDAVNECYDPIPLTEEILEDNGIGYQYGLPWYQGSYDEDGIEVHFALYCQMKLRYVHELQHALRLLGFDKEIVLK